jgi:hypothetical protein
MLNDWKQAWRQAVENFQREVHDGTPGATPSVRAMEREIVSASGALSKLDDEIRRTARETDAEREAEQVCRRRETLARTAGDDETVRIAADYAQRHAQRADVLGRKLEVLQDERQLLAADIAAMKKVIAEAAPAAPASGSVGGGARGTPPDTSADEARDRAFSQLERDARERAASERLEELKRRMRE